ncbi:MAG: hypothetical protein JO112_19770 [Planctomycetes bacterium]|nr:hypothetical protein [Planctomycetota bacterium]
MLGLVNLESRGTYKQKSQPLDQAWVSGLTLSEAQDLLDWLETQGCSRKSLTYSENEGFTVWYRQELVA